MGNVQHHLVPGVRWQPGVGWRVVGTMCTCKLPYSLSSVLPALTRREALHLVLGVTLAPTVAGCERVAPFIVSDETVEQLGLETWARLRQQMPVSQNAEAQRQVTEIARRLLVAAGEDPRRWEVQVFAEPQANAFVLTEPQDRRTRGHAPDRQERRISSRPSSGMRSGICRPSIRGSGSLPRLCGSGACG